MVTFTLPDQLRSVHGNREAMELLMRWVVQALSELLADAGRHKVFGLDLFFACKKMQDGADYLLFLSNRCRGQQALHISQTLGHRASILAHEAQGILTLKPHT